MRDSSPSRMTRAERKSSATAWAWPEQGPGQGARVRTVQDHPDRLRIRCPVPAHSRNTPEPCVSHRAAGLRIVVAGVGSTHAKE